MSSRRAIQFRLEIARKSLLGGCIGMRHPHRGHLLRFHLAEHFFPGSGVVRHLGKIQTLQRQACGFQLIVVATGAILFDQFL